jgi:hypothetical protein
MANTYTLISSNVLGSSAASVTFSAIPATYTDLVIRFSARTDASALTDVIRLQLNNDTSTNYSYIFVYGNSGGAGSSLTSSATSTLISYGSAATGTANTFSSTEIYIPNYTSSANKPISAFNVQETNDAAASPSAWASLWRNSAAITSVKLYPNTGPNFVSGSSFYLYGIKNS